MRNRLALTLIVAALAMGLKEAAAQDEPAMATADQLFSAAQGSGIDHINLLNGNLSIDIPLASFPQKGGKLPLEFDFHFQSGPAMVPPYCDDSGGTCTTGPLFAIVYFFGMKGAGAWGEDWGGAEDAPDYAHFFLVTADGVDQFAPTTGGDLQPYNNIWRAIDASGTLLSWDNLPGQMVYSVTDKSGNIWAYSGAGGGKGPTALAVNDPSALDYIPWVPDSVTDRDGNTITAAFATGGRYVASWTDTLGRVIQAPVQDADTSGCPAVNGQPAAGESYTWSLPGPGGEPARIKICLTGVYEQYVSGDGTISGYGTATQVQSIVLPNGTAWEFSFDQDPTGDQWPATLDQITLPTGGTISYTWQGGPVDKDPDWCPYFCDGYIVASRTVTAGGVAPSGTWNYSYAYAGTDPAYPVFTTVVTDPDGGTATHTFTSLDYLSPYETKVVYSGSGHTKEVDTSYSSKEPFDSDPNWPLYHTAADVVPNEVVTRWGASNATSAREFQYDTSGTFYMPVYTPPPDGTTYAGGSPWVGTLGQVTSDTATDYGPGLPGPAVRVTTTSYLFQSEPNYLAANLLDLPSSVRIDGAGSKQEALTTYGWDQSPNPACLCGNLTSTDVWTGSGPDAVTTTQFNSQGLLISAQDPDGHPPTTFSYDSPCYAGSGPTKSVLGGLTYQFCYDADTGLETSATDPNNQSTTATFDGMRRPTAIVYPDGGQTEFIYDDTAGSASIETQHLITGSRWSDEYSNLDGLGRVLSRATLNGDGGWDRVDENYNAEGQLAFRSLPCEASDPTGGAVCTLGNSYTHDDFGRLTTTTHSDGTSVQIAYAGAATETQDEGNGTARVTKVTQVDGLGRLESVCEVTGQAGDGNCGQSIAANGFLTTYTHDALGDLLSVTQGSENRSFSYDGRGLLLTATNPENGETVYTLDGDGNVLSEARANGVVVSYAYDENNRETSRTFTVNGSPDPGDTVRLSYDADADHPSCLCKGHLTRAVDGAATLAMYQFDPMGRAEVLDTIIGATTYHTTISFDKIGFPTYEAYPSGRQLYLDDDAAGRTSWIGDAVYPGGGSYYPYVAARDYLSDGALSEEDFGNGMVQRWVYRDDPNDPGSVADYERQRVDEIYIHPSGNWDYQNYRMDEYLDYNPDSTPADIRSDLGGGAQSSHYTFDALNRLIGWHTDAGVNCTFGVDRYGNLSNTSSDPGCGPLAGPGFNGKNQVVGYVYDPAGQLLSDTDGTSYGWNVEGKLNSYQTTGVNPVSAGFLYDALGRRVEKTVSGAVVATYIYNALGDMVDELDGAQYTDFVYAPAGALHGEPEARIAAVAAGGVGTIDYFHTDLLGTTRVITTASGDNLLYGVTNCNQNTNYLEGSFLDYDPFGAEISDCRQNDTAFKFTGQYRDTESGLDNFGARYYSSRLHRFMIPDPAGGDPADPKSFNLYAYVENNPVTLTDPTGLDPAQQPTSDCLEDPNSCHFLPGGECFVDGARSPCNQAEIELEMGAAISCPVDGCGDLGPYYYSPVNRLPYRLVAGISGSFYLGPNGEDRVPEHDVFWELGLPDFNAQYGSLGMALRIPGPPRVPTGPPRVTQRSPGPPAARVENARTYSRSYGAFVACEYGRVMQNADLTGILNGAPLMWLFAGNGPQALKGLGVAGAYDLAGAWDIRRACAAAVYGPGH